MKNFRFLDLFLSLSLFTSSCTAQPPAPASPSPVTPSPEMTPTVQSPTPSESPKPRVIALKTIPEMQLPPGISGESPAPEPETRKLAWEYAGNTWTWEIKVARALYLYYRGLPRPMTENYTVYVTHPLDDALAGSMASELQGVAQRENLSKLGAVELVIAMVQAIPYRLDVATIGIEEYPRYPVELLVDGTGDCEDKAILLASILIKLGYKVALVVFPDHGSLGIQAQEGMKGTSFPLNGVDYYYIEVTDSGWEIGELPDDLKRLGPHLFDMTPVPVVTQSMDASGVGTSLNVSLSIQNLGTAEAKDCYVLAGFDVGEGSLLNTQESSRFTLAPGEEESIKMYLQAPPGRYARVVTRIISGGETLSESFSGWFNTP
ncbi:MAG: hypothetical protein V1894_02475 [Chloroflexota bacterium]